MRSFSLSASGRFSSVIGITSPPGIQYEPLRAISTSGAPLTKARTTGLPCSSVMLWKVAMNL